ncbi:MAG: hypothetical protein ACT4PT_07210 [Methanobacteriota archaeon]
MKSRPVSPLAFSLLAVVPLALSGCLGGNDATDDGGDAGGAGDTGTGAGTGDMGAGSDAGMRDDHSGGMGTQARIETQTFEGTLTSAGSPSAGPVGGSSANSPDSQWLFSFSAPPATTGYVVEMVWTPTGPGSERLQILFERAGSGAADPAFARADGLSPLHLVVPAEQFEGETELQTRTFASSAGGIAVNQAFTVYVSAFVETLLDESYSAVPQ